MSWSRWVDIETLQLYSRHTISVIGAVLSFTIVAYLLNLFVPPGELRNVLETIEELTIVGLLLWLVVQYAALLWSKRPWREGSHCLVLA